MKTRMTIIGIVLLAVSSIAENITNTLGAVYSNVTIKRVEPDSLVVMGNKGIVRIPMAELPEELQHRFKYDPAKAAAHEKRRVEAQRLAFEKSREASQRARAAAEQDDPASDDRNFPLTVSQMKLSDGTHRELVTEAQGGDGVSMAASRFQDTKTYTIEAVIGNGSREVKQFQATYGGRTINDVCQPMKSTRIRITGTERSALVIICDGKQKSFL